MNLIYVSADTPNPTSRSTRRPKASEMQRLALMHLKLCKRSHAVAVLRNNGFAGVEEVVNALLSSVRDILYVRENRTLVKIERRVAGWRYGLPVAKGREAVRLPEGQLPERLQSWRAGAVVSAAQQVVRHGAAGGNAFTVQFTTDPAQVGYQIKIRSNYDTYGGRYKGWAAREDHHYIVVPIDWRMRVMKRGLETAGGLLTLSAQQMLGPTDVEVFLATWVEQSRGFSVNVRHGYIARIGSDCYHASSAEDAIRGVRRKSSTSGLVGVRVSALDCSTEVFVKRYGRYCELLIDVSDAYDVGACEFGVRSWCHQVGIEPDEGAVPLGRVLDAFKDCPMCEVRKTILHVVAEHRLALRALRRATVQQALPLPV
jgi:hypothetical protein